MEASVDWWARSLAILAMLISAAALYFRIRQYQKQKPTLNVEQSSMKIPDQFDEGSLSYNSAALRTSSKDAYKLLEVPVEVSMMLRNSGLAPTTVTLMYISLESARARTVDIKLDTTIKSPKKTKFLGQICENLVSEPFLYLKPAETPLNLPFTIRNGQAIECQGVSQLQMPVPQDVFKRYREYKSELKMPLDLLDFVIETRGFNAEKSIFRVQVWSGSEVLCNAAFNRNKYLPFVWSSRR